MKLTNEQIQFIDNYLKEQKVKFWDVRIELIDHVASKLEENPQLKLTRTFLIKEFGTSVTLQNLIAEKQKIINKKYRRRYFKEIGSFLKNPKKVVVFGVIIFLYFVLGKYLSYKSFKIVSTLLFIFPVILYLFLGLKNHLKKEKSIHLERALFYVVFAFYILNIFFQVIKPKGMFDDSGTIQKTTLFIIVSLNAFLTYCGYLVYKITFKEYSSMYKQLKSL